jgi:hypothetical protein
MSESDGIDSVLERAMPKPYSVDLHARVIEDVDTGASRREAAERYGISPSVVVIWVQRFETSSPLDAPGRRKFSRFSVTLRANRSARKIR